VTSAPYPAGCHIPVDAHALARSSTLDAIDAAEGHIARLKDTLAAELTYWRGECDRLRAHNDPRRVLMTLADALGLDPTSLLPEHAPDLDDCVTAIARHVIEEEARTVAGALNTVGSALARLVAAIDSEDEERAKKALEEARDVLAGVGT
jgi:hypothetical protein